MATGERSLRNARRSAAVGVLAVTGLAVGVGSYFAWRMQPPAEHGAGHPAVGRRWEFPAGWVPGATAGDPAGPAAAVLLTFWGPWCGPCRRELPELAVLMQRHRAAGVRWVAVSCPPGDEDSGPEHREETWAIWKANQLPGEPQFDADGAWRAAARQAGAFRDAYPTVVLLDRQQIIRGVWTGSYWGTVQAISAQLDVLLRGSG